MKTWSWAGNLATVAAILFVVPAPALRALAVPGYRNLVVPSIGVALAAGLCVIQYVQLARRDRADLAEARELRDAHR